MENDVDQGTMFGPCLWNSFFADVAVPANSTGEAEGMFADSLNLFQQKKFSNIFYFPEKTKQTFPFFPRKMCSDICFKHFLQQINNAIY